MLNALPPHVFFVIAGFFGLVIGSFLTVVIHRLPTILKRDWRTQCLEFLDLPDDDDHKTYNIVIPRSQCPHCNHPLKAVNNIPLFSYLFQRGKCTFCKHSISLKYPSIELLSTVLTLFLFVHFGFTGQAVFAMIFSWSLLCLSFIDAEHQVLPDNITLPLLWLGLLINLFGVFTDYQSAIIGAVVGYGSLWSIAAIFKLITKKDVMGNGDFKLLALIGAWLGWQVLPLVILLSSFVGAILGILLILSKGRDRYTPLPFGPYLAIAGWIAMMWGQHIIAFYLRFIGF